MGQDCTESRGWLVLEVGLPSPALADQVAQVAASMMGRGVEQRSSGGRWWVVAYLAPSQAGLMEQLSALAGAVAGGRAEVRRGWIEERDWNMEWKRHYRPVEIGQGLVVVPSWMDWEGGPRLVIRIDPGQAFGTGTHATTAMVLELMERLWRGARSPSPVLDVGTGTGILAVAAALMGSDEVVAVDTDPLALEAARSNCRLNGVQDRVRLPGAALGEIGRTFPAVLANLDAPTLRGLAGELAARLEPGGRLLVSGILQEQEEEMVGLFEGLGLGVGRRLAREGWVALELEGTG